MAVAFALVFGAGLSTTVGAALAFFAKINDASILAGSLGISAGVMLYVSFIEIFSKSVESFELEGESTVAADRWAVCCFFGGMAITYLIDLIVHKIAGASLKPEAKVLATHSAKKLVGKGSHDQDCPKGDVEAGSQEESSRTAHAEGNAAIKQIIALDGHEFELKKLGLLSGVAIALHNLPEGLATFVSTLADKTSGAAIAFAIAIHNIPEGIVVAMPIFYATNSRTKAFLWASLAGVSEPIGGFLGWVVLSNMGDIIYAIMFGLVGGMMVYISIRDLIPTALRFDPSDRAVSMLVLVGMMIMALSILLFEID